MNPHIIGTSHISKDSINEIKSSIENEKPDIVAVELDAQRAMSLLQKEVRKISFLEMTKLGVKGLLFAKIGQYVQQKLGQKE